MCIFSKPVSLVESTRIFGRLTGTGSQLLVYQMRYESQEQNAMILPVPVRTPAQEESVRFIDLETYPEFFKSLESAFPYIPRGSIGCSAEKSNTATASALQVHEVGNYVASFVPCLADFERLDPQFTIPADTWNKIPEYHDYGFVVFQLAELSGEPHPMALEFETRAPSIFFPTVHIHDGEVHEQEHFDHVLYLQHASLDSRVGRYENYDVADNATGLVRSAASAGRYCDTHRSRGVLAPDLLLHRTFLRGSLKNEDTIYEFTGGPAARPIREFLLRRFLPWVVSLAAIGWFFHRRNIVKQSATTPGPNESPHDEASNESA